MPLKALRTVSKARNGVSTFILPCKRLDFHYCDWAGSSRGMNSFLQSPLFTSFASSHPSIEMTISPRPSHHPIIRATYTTHSTNNPSPNSSNGDSKNRSEKVICVKNLTKEQIAKKVEILRDASGEKARRRLRIGVVTTGGLGGENVGKGGGRGSVRGVWSPFHQKFTEGRWKI